MHGSVVWNDVKRGCCRVIESGQLRHECDIYNDIFDRIIPGHCSAAEGWTGWMHLAGYAFSFPFIRRRDEIFFYKIYWWFIANFSVFMRNTSIEYVYGWNPQLSYISKQLPIHLRKTNIEEMRNEIFNTSETFLLFLR